MKLELPKPCWAAHDITMGYFVNLWKTLASRGRATIISDWNMTWSQHCCWWSQIKVCWTGDTDQQFFVFRFDTDQQPSPLKLTSSCCTQSLAEPELSALLAPNSKKQAKLRANCGKQNTFLCENKHTKCFPSKWPILNTRGKNKTADQSNPWCVCDALGSAQPMQDTHNLG